MKWRWYIKKRAKFVDISMFGIAFCLLGRIVEIIMEFYAIALISIIFKI